MPNPENLDKSRLDKISKEEARKIQKAGGKAVVESKRAKKTIAEILDGLDSRFLKQKIENIKNNPKLTEDKKKEYVDILKDSDNVMAFELYMIAMSSTINPQTKLKAIEDVLDRRYGKPKQEIEGSGNIAITGLNFEIKK